MIQSQKFLLFLFFSQVGWVLNAEQPITLFCHGIVDNHTQMNRYLPDFVMKPYQVFDFPDAQTPTNIDLNTLIFNASSKFGKLVNRNNMAMGHGIDIATLKYQIDPKQQYILYGLSRGGATIVSYLAQNNPTNIAGIVLDAAPADVVDAVNALQYTIGYKFAPDRATQETIFHNLFPAYPKNSVAAVQAIKTITNKKLPIFIVNSLDDARVPITSAWQLYLAFRQAEFEHVYLCQLEHGVHANYMQGPDKLQYLQALHSFYKAYGFAYNPEYATMTNLSSLQPSIETIKEDLQNFKATMERNYLQQETSNRNYSYMAIAALLVMGIAHKTLTSDW